MKYLEQFKAWIEANALIASAAGIGGVILLCFLSYFIAKRLVVRGIKFVAARTTTNWDDLIVKRGVFDRLAQIAPAVVLYYFTNIFPEGTENTLQQLIVGYIQLIIMLVIGSLLTAFHDIYRTTEGANEFPIKSYLQIAKLVVYLIGGVLIFATILGESPWKLLSGIGAATAILLLVFKDTILSFVASIQLVANDMVRIGDWISMPQYNADGDVLDVALHTVKVQNWDKTITTIPTHKFISESFKNWRGMQTSGGRRIMRSLYLDQSSIRFLENADMVKLSKIALLKDYLKERETQIKEANEKAKIDPSSPANGRRMTNVGTFRAYVERYLKSHSGVNQNMTLLVRQLEAGPQGLPIQLYLFTSDIAWAVYESTQADIFDHLFSIVPEFGLRLFQEPSGHSFETFRRATAGQPEVATSTVDLIRTRLSEPTNPPE